MTRLFFVFFDKIIQKSDNFMDKIWHLTAKCSDF